MRNMNSGLSGGDELKPPPNRLSPSSSAFALSPIWVFQRRPRLTTFVNRSQAGKASPNGSAYPFSPFQARLPPIQALHPFSSHPPPTRETAWMRRALLRALRIPRCRRPREDDRRQACGASMHHGRVKNVVDGEQRCVWSPEMISAFLTKGTVHSAMERSRHVHDARATASIAFTTRGRTSAVHTRKHTFITSTLESRLWSELWGRTWNKLCLQGNRVTQI